MSDAFLSSASSTMRRASASASSSGVALARGTGFVRRGRPARIGVGSDDSSIAVSLVVLRAIQMILFDVRLDGLGHEIADRLAGGDSLADVCGRVAQPARMELKEAVGSAREVLVEPAR